jgi:hypothetical protein
MGRDLAGRIFKLPVPAHSDCWICLDGAGYPGRTRLGNHRHPHEPGRAQFIADHSGKRIAFFWLLLFFYCVAAVGIVWPADGKQLAMFIILFVGVGWMAMGLLLSFASIWWGLALTALALIGYFLLPGIFYLWMAILGGGGMIALGLYIRSRW